jgi:hypothetical protein
MTSRCRCPAELEGIAAAGKPNRGAMAKLSDRQRRALQLLARRPNGCTEALLTASGFQLDLVSELVRARLAAAQPRLIQRPRRGESIGIIVIAITAAGRKAIA